LPSLIANGSDTLSDEPQGLAWLSPVAARGIVEAGNGTAASRWSAAGIAGGYDSAIATAVGVTWAGAAFGYLNGQSSTPSRLSTIQSETVHAAIYGGTTQGAWTVSGTIEYGVSQIESERRILIGSLDRTATADYWAHTVGVSTEAAYAIDLTQSTTLSPLFTLDAGWSGHSRFTEEGAGALNLTGSASSTYRVNTGLGVALSHELQLESGIVTLDVRGIWEHTLADDGARQTMTFAGGPDSFNVTGAEQADDRLKLGIGASWKPTDRVEVRLGYDGMFSAAHTSHALSVNAALKF
jgi:outer membrane autotransporter protein